MLGIGLFMTPSDLGLCVDQISGYNDLIATATKKKQLERLKVASMLMIKLLL